MLRVPQHERKNIDDIKSLPFVLSFVEGLRERSSTTCLSAISRRKFLGL
jgi:hypothetical protein